MLVTVSSDSSLRIWNFETMKCEVVHVFKNDEPQSVAIHISGSWCGVVCHLMLYPVTSYHVIYD